MIENIDLSDINDTRREWIITSYAGMNKDLRMIFIEDLPIKRLIICYENNKYYYLILDNNDLFM